MRVCPVLPGACVHGGVSVSMSSRSIIRDMMWTSSLILFHASQLASCTRVLRMLCVLGLHRRAPVDRPISWTIICVSCVESAEMRWIRCRYHHHVTGSAMQGRTKRIECIDNPSNNKLQIMVVSLLYICGRPWTKPNRWIAIMLGRHC